MSIKGFEYAAPGIGNVGSYLISGIPFVTGGLSAPSSSATPIVVTFPSVTQRFWVHVGDGSKKLRVGFSANGVKNTNYFVVDGDASNNTSQVQEFRVRCDKVFLLGDDAASNTTKISIMGELTGIVAGFDVAASYSGSAGIG